MRLSCAWWVIKRLVMGDEGGGQDLRSIVGEFRRRTGSTQAALASRLHVSERYVRAVEAGRNLGPSSLRNLTKVMREAGQFDLARFVAQMTISERDFRSLQAEIGILQRQVKALQDRVGNMEARRQERNRGVA
jgi:transcriptional regulator with XRE-family HTH domain